VEDDSADIAIAGPRAAMLTARDTRNTCTGRRTRHNVSSPSLHDPLTQAL